MTAFSMRLKTERESCALDVRDAAARVGVEPAQYRMWENGNRTPSPERQSAILASLSVPVVTGDNAEYQRGALWALAAMHETLARCYRDLAQPAPAIPLADLTALRAMTAGDRPVVPAPAARPRRRAGG